MRVKRRRTPSSLLGRARPSPFHYFFKSAATPAGDAHCLLARSRSIVIYSHSRWKHGDVAYIDRARVGSGCAEKMASTRSFAPLLVVLALLLVTTRTVTAALQHHERAAAFEGYNEVHQVAASAKEADAVAASATPPSDDPAAAQPAPASDFEFVITTSYGKVRGRSGRRALLLLACRRRRSPRDRRRRRSLTSAPPKKTHKKTKIKIRITPRPDLSPKIVQAVSELAASGKCDGCRFYRHEPVPSNWSSGGFYGPPYALLQGSLAAVGVDLPFEGNPKVQRGDVIGSVGTAEGAYLAHLHFEVRLGPYVNPGQGYADTPLNRVAPEQFIRAHRGTTDEALYQAPQNE